MEFRPRWEMLRLFVAGLSCVVFGCGEGFGSAPKDAEPDRTIRIDAGYDDGGIDASADAGSGKADAAAKCPEGACNVLSNEGCDAGAACRYLPPEEGASYETLCGPVGEGGGGDPCEGHSDCGTNLVCLRGTCRHYCCGDDGCPAGQACDTTLRDPVTDEPTRVGLCSVPDVCDPLTQEGCAEGEGCYPTPDGQSCAVPRGDAADKTAGDPCEFGNDCPIGMVCVGSMETEGNVCRELCDVGAEEPDCPAGSSCAGLGDRGDNVGLCRPDTAGGGDAGT